MKKYFRDLIHLLTGADLILIGSILVIAIFFYIHFNSGKTARFVEIYRENDLLCRHSLASDGIIEIDDGILVEIREGKVRMLSSTCKNQYCVRQGWSDTYPIICVPNRISVVIKGAEEMPMLMTW
ncbi:MAG: NusG domain II-containing protein [Candidatus Cloacimonetes bacterium]|nr:NusG domain II-containing protein [Candidatus Cloacimonadota bacterium]